MGGKSVIMKYHLTEIFNIEELYQLCESFTNITGVVTAILDLEGKVYVATGWRSICTKFHRVHPDAAKLCTESDTALAGQLESGQKYNVYKCKNGLMDVAMPIFVGDTHIGNFFTGQFFTEKPDLEHFRRQAQKYGFNEQEYMDALAEVPVFTDDEIKANISFLVQLTEIVGNIGLKNLVSKSQNQQLQAEKQNLKKANKEYQELNEEYCRINLELTEAKERIEESEETYRMLFDSVNDAILTAEMQEDGSLGKFIIVNDIACDRLGYTREELLNLSPADINSERTRITLNARVQELLIKKHFIAETEHVTKEGRVIPTELSANVSNFNGKTLVHTLARDITERKQSEEALRRSEEDLKESQRIAHVGSWHLDVASNQVIWSDELFRMYGMAPSSSPPPFNEHHKLFTPDSWEKLSVALENTKQTRVPYELELETVRSDGGNGWMWVYGKTVVNENDEVVGLFGAAQDITDRKQAEETIRKSEEMTRLFFERQLVGMAITSPEKGWVRVNDRLCEILGYSRDELVETTWDILTYQEDLEADFAEFEKLLAGEIDDYSLEKRFVRKDGRLVHTNLAVACVRNSDGSVDYVMALLEDITERKQAEEDLQQLNAHLEQRVQERTEELKGKNNDLEHAIAKLQETQSQLILFEKMTVLRHLISGIAHEINNPLGAIDSCRELINIALCHLSNNFSKISHWLSGPEGDLLTELITNAQSDSNGNLGMSSREKRKLRKELEIQLEEKNIANAKEVGAKLVEMNSFDKIDKLMPLLRHDDILDKLQSVGYIMDAFVACSTIKTAVAKSSKIVNTLRGYVRKDGSIENKVPADIKEGIETVLTLFQSAFKYFVTLEINIDDDLPEINCFPDQLNQVWTNIIQNALQAMNNSGKLTIDGKRQGDGVVISVSDEGCGMSPEVQARIFEPLFTTKPAGEGIGLGMDIVHMIIVQRHSGRIDIDSEVGVGTTISVWLPIN